MNLLFILSILIFTFIGFYIFLNGVKEYISKKSKGYIFFRVLFSIITLLYLIYILNGFAGANLTSEIGVVSSLGTVLIFGLPILGASIGIGILSKILFKFIFNTFYLEGTKKILLQQILITLFLLIILTLLSFVIPISLALLNIINGGFIEFSSLIYGIGLSIGLTGLGFGLGLSLFFSGLLLYLEKRLSGNKLKYILISILLFLLFIILISIPVIYSLIYSFSVIKTFDINSNVYIYTGLLLGILGLTVTYLQGYLFYLYHKNNSNKFIFNIFYIILLQILVLISLYISFNILNN